MSACAVPKDDLTALYDCVRNDPNLSSTQELLMREIIGLHAKGGCYASYAYLAQRRRKAVGTIRNLICSLRKAGYLVDVCETDSSRPGQLVYRLVPKCPDQQPAARLKVWKNPRQNAAVTASEPSNAVTKMGSLAVTKSCSPQADTTDSMHEDNAAASESLCTTHGPSNRKAAAAASSQSEGDGTKTAEVRQPMPVPSAGRQQEAQAQHELTEQQRAVCIDCFRRGIDESGAEQLARQGCPRDFYRGWCRAVDDPKSRFAGSKTAVVLGKWRKREWPPSKYCLISMAEARARIQAGKYRSPSDDPRHTPKWVADRLESAEENLFCRDEAKRKAAKVWLEQHGIDPESVVKR